MLGLHSLVKRWAGPSVKSKLIVIPHTHWDREWYLPFQEFRFRLVQALDETLDLLLNQPEYRHFTLDGQAILLEDYLEIRPERRSQVEELVRTGRLSVGPWYVLPDQFLVSPEALIRNLLLGHQIAEQFGEVLKVGYLPDPFGHVSQLPQLLRGFGIDTAVLWRGVGEDRASEFVWRGPDASEILVVYLADGYNNAAVLPDPQDGLLKRVRQLAENLRQKAATEYLALMNGDDHAMPQANVPALIAHANALLPDAELIHGSLTELIEGIRAAHRRDRPDLPLLHGELRSPRLSPILPGVLSTRMWLKQRNASCETWLERLAEPLAVLGDLAAGQAARPGARHRGFLRTAWRHLLQNHPHDSVTGCSVDQVHEEMRVRFDWAEQIARSVAEDGLRRLAAAIQTEDDQGWASQALIVFNPEGQPRTDVVNATVSVPKGGMPAIRDDRGQAVPCQIVARRETPVLSETLTRGHLSMLAQALGINGTTSWSDGKIDGVLRMARLLSRGRLPKLGLASFRLDATDTPGTVEARLGTTADGKHDYQAVRQGLQALQHLLQQPGLEYIRLTVTKWEQAEICFLARDVPALGYRRYWIGSQRERLAATPVGAWSPDASTIENEFFRVSADAPSGTVTVIDKTTGRVYPRLNRFVDDGEAGDEYTHAAPASDTVVDAPRGPASVRVVQEGPVTASLVIEQEYELPSALAPNRRSRVRDRRTCPIRATFRLSAGVRRIGVEVEVDNHVADHRLRVFFPTGLRAAWSHAESAFWVEQRPVALPDAARDWAEQPAGTNPQRRFVDVSDGEHGLLIGVQGLPEYEVVETAEGAVLALTLLRCVGWLSRGDLAERPGHAGPMLPTPGAQCPGRHHFAYCLVPHRGDWTSAYRQAHHFSLPFLIRAEEPHAGHLPAAGSFLSLEGDGIALSALKPAEERDGLVVRCYNTLATPTKAQLVCGFKLRRAERLDLREQHLETLVLEDPTSIALHLEPGEIVTLRLDVAA